MGWPRHEMWAVIHVSQWVRLLSFHPGLSDHSLYNGLGARSNIVFLWLQSTNHLPLLLTFHRGGNMTVILLSSGVRPYLERHLAHPRPSLHMHMHGLKQSKCCKTEPSSHEGTSRAVTRLQDWAGGVWHGSQASGCPSWVLSLFPAVLPHSLPVPHALQKKCFLKIFKRHMASFYWNYCRDQSCHESTSADHWDSNAVSTQDFLS